jgi:hypothetical protein
MDLQRRTDDQLIALWFHANAELHRRGVKLWHPGDLAEILVSAAIGGARAGSNVQRGYDVIAPDGARWEIKALVNRPGKTRTTVGHLRPGTFDFLAIVVFAPDMASVSAWKVPQDIVAEYGRWDDEKGAHRVELTQRLRRDDRVTPLGLSVPQLSPGDV